MKELVFDFSSWPDVEGSIDLFFGGLGSGKTYAATADILRDLRAGRVVFATWPIQFDGLDERKNWFKLFISLFGFKRTFYDFDKSNFHYVPLTDPDFMKKFSTSVDCIWYVDEAYAVIDSYVKNKMSLSDRFAIYGTRHFNRRLVLVAQRPTSIHVAARAMVNRFYRCERPFPFIQKLLHFTFFVRTEFQDMIDENVDLEKPLSTRWYFGHRAVFKSYNSKYLRGTLQTTVKPLIHVYRTNPISTLLFLFKRNPGRKAGTSVPAVPSPIRTIRDIHTH
jgi:hypothetical protein